MKFPLFKYLKKSVAYRMVVGVAIIGCLTIQATSQKTSSLVRSIAPEASVIPIERQGNPDCAELNSVDATWPNITSDFELKIDSPFSHGGPWLFQSSGNRSLIGPTDLSNSVTTSGTSTTLSFTSTKAISAVILKAGPSANIYYYPNGSLGDTNLVVAQSSISHVTFCYYQPASVTIIKSVTTANNPPNNTSSSIAFSFSATNLNQTNFSLVDQDVVGPDRYSQSNIYKFAPPFNPGTVISVTEALAPPNTNFSLANITCSEVAGGGLPNLTDSTTDILNRTVNIRLQQGENVTCTFHNTQLTPSAAPASVSGRTVDSLGNGIGGVRVVLMDAQTGQTFVAITNPFGYYTIEGPEVNNFYVMTVSHKRYVFADGTRSFTLNEDLFGVDFIANPME